MLSNKIQCLLCLIILVGSIVSCSTPTGPSELYKGESARQIYTRGKKALQNKSYGEAVKRFEALDIQYPYGSDTEPAQLYLIYAYYMKGEYILAAATADRFIHTYPVSPHVDYVYYLRGLSNYHRNMGILEKLVLIDVSTRDLSQIRKAYQDFDELLVRFPNSQYTPSAHQYMVYLRNILAAHELDVARYYYHRRAYVASADRASGLVAHYQGAPSVVDGLVLMAKSYHQLGLTKLEQDTLKVLKYNYPNVRV